MKETAQAYQLAFALEEFLPYRLAVLAHSVSRALSSVYARKFGLSIPEWRILANLGRFGSLYAGELAERSSLDKPKVTRALQKLETSKLVQRQVNGRDRRQVRLSLTRQGRSMFRRIAVLALDWESQFLATLRPAERKAFDHVLTKLMRRSEDMRAMAERSGASSRSGRNAEAP